MSLSNNKDLLRQIIITHYDNPIHKIDNKIDDKKYVSFHNKSSSCIDDFEVFIKIENNQIIDAKFFGIGCAISTASIDILCDLIINREIDVANNIFDQYHAMINDENYDEELLEELIAFKDINKQPNRIKCALIGVKSLENITKSAKNE